MRSKGSTKRSIKQGLKLIKAAQALKGFLRGELYRPTPGGLHQFLNFRRTKDIFFNF